MNTTILALLALALPVGATAQAQARVQTQAPAAQQTVWRCGADGRSYSSMPCADGRPLAVSMDVRPDADVQAARLLSGQERQEADRLRHDRLQQQARQGNGLAAIAGAKPAPATSAARAAALHNKPQKAKLARPQSPLQQLGSTQPSDAGTWQATAPASRRTKG